MSKLLPQDKRTGLTENCFSSDRRELCNAGWGCFPVVCQSDLVLISSYVCVCVFACVCAGVIVCVAVCGSICMCVNVHACVCTYAFIHVCMTAEPALAFWGP